MAVVLVGNIAHLVRGGTRVGGRRSIAGGRLGGLGLRHEPIGRLAGDPDLHGPLMAAHLVARALRELQRNPRRTAAIFVGRDREDVAHLTVVHRDRARRPDDGGVGKVKQQPMRGLMLRNRVTDGAIRNHAHDGLLRRLLHEDVPDNPLV